MKKIINLTKYNLKLLFRDTPSILMAFLMPVGFYVLFGYMLKDFAIQGTSMTTLLVPLYIIIIIGNAVLSVFGTYYAIARESGNIQKFKFLGMNELRYAGSLFAAIMFFQMIVILTFLIFVYFYSGSIFPLARIIPILGTLLMIELYHFALTFLLISVIKKATAYNGASMAIYMFQMFLGGLTFPLEMFPTFLQKLVYFINPIIYGRDALLGSWTGLMSDIDILKNNVILLCFAGLFIIAAYIFNKVSFKQKTMTVI